MKAYKLTDSKCRTRNEMQWGEGVEHSETGRKTLCNPGLIHAYLDPRQAVFMAPSYGYSGDDSILWECEIQDDGIVTNNGTKIGVHWLKTIQRIAKPKITMIQLTRLGILCALSVVRPGSIPVWENWAYGWLFNIDHSAAAAAEAEAEAAWLSEAAWRSAAEAEAAAWRSAEAAADACRSAAAWRSAEAAVDACRSAEAWRSEAAYKFDILPLIDLAFSPDWDD